MKIEYNVLIQVTEEDIKDGSFSVPEGVTKIGNSAFWSCDSLRKVQIPDTVKKIGEYAFCKCTSLQEIHIPDSVMGIDRYAFGGCKLLQKVRISERVTKIKEFAFSRCTSLQRVQIPDSVTEIDTYAFFGCESLQEIKLPSGVTEISDSVFCGCESLREVEIPDSVTIIGEYAFYRCKSLERVQIPDSVTEIGYYSFGECESLKNIMWKGKTYHVKCIDGYCMNIRNRKTLHDITIIKCSYFPEENIVYVAEKGNYAAHGDSIHRAVEDLQFKIQNDLDLSEHIQRIAKQGFMDANDYRLITGACREGTNRFLVANNLTWDDKMPVEKVLQLTKGQYGYDRFKDIAEQILKLM